MSKRNSVGAANTLFNYFSKTPPANKKVKTEAELDESPKLNSSVPNGDKESKAESKYNKILWLTTLLLHFVHKIKIFYSTIRMFL